MVGGVLLELLSDIQCGLVVDLQARHMYVLHLTVGKILDLGDKGRSRTNTLTGPVHVTVVLLALLWFGASNKYEITGITIDGGDVCRLLWRAISTAFFCLSGYRDTSMHLDDGIVYFSCRDPLGLTRRAY